MRETLRQCNFTPLGNYYMNRGGTEPDSPPSEVSDYHPELRNGEVNNYNIIFS